MDLTLKFETQEVVGTNLLHARFERNGGRSFAGLEDELRVLLPEFGQDWRRRKVLILLARIAEERGEAETAIRRVQQAVNASDDISSRHRPEDLGYLKRLLACGAGDRTEAAARRCS